MHTLRKVLSVLLVVILVPLLWGQIAATAVRSLMTEPELLKNLARDSGFYVEVQRSLSRGIRQDGPGFFTDADLQRILDRALPPEQLAVLGDATIDGLHFWLVTGTDRPAVSLPLAPLKQNLRQVLREELDLKLKSLPVCTGTQWAQSAQSGSITCRPADERLAREYMDRAMASLNLNEIPDTLDLAATLEQSDGPQFWVQASASVATVRLFLTLIPWGWVAIGVLLVLLALLNLDRWYAPFGWIAAALLIGGGLMFIGALLFSALLPSVGIAAGDLGMDLVERAVGVVALSVRNLSLLISLIGLGSLIAAFAIALLMPDRRASQPPAATPPQDAGMM